MVERVFAVTGSIGAGILMLALSIGMFGAVFVGGHWVAEKQQSKWQGVVAGVLALVVVVLLFGPSLAALEEQSCVSATDHDSCMEGPNE